MVDSTYRVVVVYFVCLVGWLVSQLVSWDMFLSWLVGSLAYYSQCLVRTSSLHVVLICMQHWCTPRSVDIVDNFQSPPTFVFCSL